MAKEMKAYLKSCNGSAKVLRCLVGLSFIGSLGLTSSLAADLVYAKDGSGVYGYRDTPKLPWCQWLVHDPDRPAPKRVDPGQPAPPAPVPDDALVLFDGKDVSKWQAMGDWKVADGCLVSGNSHFATKDSFGDMQLHLEWLAPAGFEGPWYNRGNNGVMLMGRYEIQIFDSFNKRSIPTAPARLSTARPHRWSTPLGHPDSGRLMTSCSPRHGSRVRSWLRRRG